MATKPKAPANRLKAKVWSKTMTMEIDGSIDGAMPDIMFMVDSKERREKIISKINEIHASMCASADEASVAA